MSTVTERLAALDAANKSGFDDWLRRPEVKLILSMLPKADNEDLVQTIVRSAYDAGFGTAAGHIFSYVVSDLLKGRAEGL